MAKWLLHIIACILTSICCCTSALAQSGFFVPATGKIFFSGDSATIFNNVFNAGQLGIGANAVLNFKGLVWANDQDALLPGGNVSQVGGVVRFLVPEEWYNGSVQRQQSITGGFNAVTKTGPSFSKLFIANRYGVRLEQSALHVSDLLQLEDGSVYTNSNTLVVGKNDPGRISGYNNARFIVTDGGGVLLRQQLSRKTGDVVFPVGSTVYGYAPATIFLKNDTPDDFYTGVNDGVLKDVFAGNSLKDYSVNQTWQIGKMLRPGIDEVLISLQHQIPNEGVAFAAHRGFSYISQFRAGAWDTGSLRIKPVSPGSITTGALLANSATNTRTFAASVGTQNFFTKFSYPFADTAHTTLMVNGFRLNAELVKIVWTTRPEVGVKYFMIQRRLANQSGWTTVDTANSRATNGYSFNYLNYHDDDPNKYEGLSFYRIVMVGYQGELSYSDVITINGMAAPSRFAVWPNPSTGRFMVSIDKLQRVKTLVIWNAIGQKIREVDVRNQELVELYLFTPGNYVIGFISNERVIENRKLVITGW